MAMPPWRIVLKAAVGGLGAIYFRLGAVLVAASFATTSARRSSSARVRAKQGGTIDDKLA